MARMQLEVERKMKKKSPIADIVSFKIFITFQSSYR